MQRWGLVGAALLMAAAPAAAQLPVPTPGQIQSFRQSDGILPALVAVEPLTGWDRALKVELAKGVPEEAADRLAARYSLSPVAMRELVLLWLASQTEVAESARFVPAGRATLDAELSSRFAALMAANGRSPLLLQAAAVGLRGGFGEDRCTDEGYDVLMRASADPVDEGWLLARAANCPSWYRRFAVLHPEHRTVALLALAFDEELERADRLALLEHLTSAAAAARIDTGDRPFVLARLRADYVGALLQAGLVDAAFRVDAALDADARQHLLDTRPARIVRVEGLPLGIPETAPDGSDDEPARAVTRATRSNQFLTAELAAGYSVGGRTDAARALFATLDHARDVADALACVEATRAAPPAAAAPTRCPTLGSQGWRLLLLDHAIERSGDDPFPIAEMLVTGSNSEVTGVWAELACHILREPQYAELCGRLRETTRGSGLSAVSLDGAPDDPVAVSTKIAPAVLTTARARFASLLAARPGAVSNSTARAADAGRQGPAVTPFAEAAIPPAMLGTGRPQSWDRAWAKLPPGFVPVRVDGDKHRIAVVSVSQTYDPTGEVSRGGYWVHLSNDDGRSWETPLYTGLSERYPYVVPAQSALPLLDGDTLHLAVDVSELDPRSITYPPIHLETVRRAQGRFLTIPLAALRRDTDGDGVTDVTARHLLLDAPINGAPRLIPASAAPCADPVDDVRPALAAFLAKLFAGPTGADVEPVNPPPGAMPRESRSATASPERPILIEADPADLTCLRTGRLTIVYRRSDVDRMRQMVPDFHAVKLGHLLFNRSRTRGVFSYSLGWRGGTARLRRTGTGWVVEPASSWIT